MMTTRPRPETADSGHKPVMLDEVLAALDLKDGDKVVDGTFGGGGYTRAILTAAKCAVFAIDRDLDAIMRAEALAARLRQSPRDAGLADEVDRWLASEGR